MILLRHGCLAGRFRAQLGLTIFTLLVIGISLKRQVDGRS